MATENQRDTLPPRGTASATTSRCPACITPGKYWHTLNNTRIDRCCACGHGYVWPRPSRILTNQFYISLKLDGALDHHDYRRRRSSGQHEPELVARHLARLGKSGGNLLDVGAGEGRFTHWFMDHGFTVTPLEINPGLATRLVTATGRNVITEPFELWSPEGGKTFDVIVISQVLEHVPDAGLWLDHATSLLARNGVLFVSVPSFESLLVRAIGWREGNINPPTHLNFFTDRSLTHLATARGLTSVFRHTPNILPAAAAMDAAAGALPRLPRALGLATGLVAWGGLSLAAPIGMGRFLHAYFTRDAGSPPTDTA